MERLAEVAREGLRTDIPGFDPGDTVRVMVRVREGDKERLQAFEGIVIAKPRRRHQRDLHGPEDLRRRRRGAALPAAQPHHRVGGVMRRGRVRRAKLYYLRALSGKAARIREKREG